MTVGKTLGVLTAADVWTYGTRILTEGYVDMSLAGDASYVPNAGKVVTFATIINNNSAFLAVESEVVAGTWVYVAPLAAATKNYVAMGVVGNAKTRFRNTDVGTRQFRFGGRGL